MLVSRGWPHLRRPSAVDRCFAVGGGELEFWANTGAIMLLVHSTTARHGPLSTILLLLRRILLNASWLVNRVMEDAWLAHVLWCMFMCGICVCLTPQRSRALNCAAGQPMGGRRGSGYMQNTWIPIAVGWLPVPQMERRLAEDPGKKKEPLSASSPMQVPGSRVIFLTDQ